MITAAIISDIHNGPDQATKNGAAALGLLDGFVAFAQARRPDLVVDLGDRVNHVDAETDADSLRAVAARFARLAAPHFHLIGNHDVDYLTRAQNAELLGAPASSTVHRAGDITFIFWCPDVSMNRTRNLDMAEADFVWLEGALRDAAYPAVICTHVPLDQGAVVGNYYYQAMKGAAEGRLFYPVAQGERLRDLIERSGQVVLCLNGHTHWNTYHAIDGIHYVTLPSLIETFPTAPKPTAAWTWLEIADGMIDIEVFGNLPIRYRFPMRAPDARWLRPSVRKRSIRIGGHATSISLEDEFWDALKTIAAARGQALNNLIAEIDSTKKGANLSSALRLFVLRQYSAGEDKLHQQ